MIHNNMMNQVLTVEIGEDDKRDFQQLVQQLLDAGRIESSAAKGIAMKIVSDGTESLSKKQEDTFINIVKRT